MRELLRAELSKRRSPFAAMNFIEARDATSFDESVRAEVAVTQREFASQQAALATVIEGAGFFAATVRGVATGVALLARTSFPQRVFEHTDEAALWVASKLDDLGASQAPTLVAAIASLRRPAK